MTGPAETVVRASSLPMFPDCPRRWAAKTLFSEIKAAGFDLRSTQRHIGAAVGTATHAAIGHDMTAKMASGDLPPPQEGDEAGTAALDTELAEGASWDEITPTRDVAQKQVIRMTRIYRYTVAQHITPVSVEQRHEARHPTGLILSGQADLIVDAPAVLRDTKTGRVHRQNAAQYGSYSRLLRSHGIPIIGIVEDYIKRTALKKEQPEPVSIPISIERAEAIAEAVLKRAAADIAEWRATGNPDAFLSNPSSMLCTDRFCPAWGTQWCLDHKKEIAA